MTVLLTRADEKSSTQRLNPTRYARSAALNRLTAYLAARPHASRNVAIVLLRFDLELPVFRISALNWRHVVGHGGIRRRFSKAVASDRRHQALSVTSSVKLRAALLDLHRDQGNPRSGAVIRRELGDRSDVRMIVNWLVRRYDVNGNAQCGAVGYHELPTKASRLSTFGRLKGHIVRI